MRAELHCADCPEPARYRLLGLNKCTDHYIEALERSAHIVSADFEARRALNEAADQIDRARVERLAERIAKRAKEKKAREELTGRREGNLPADSITG